MIPRNSYLEDLISFREKQLIKVVTGIRRLMQLRIIIPNIC